MSKKKDLLPRRNSPGPKIKFTPELQDLFLRVFSECNSIRQAAIAVKIDSKTVYNHKRDNPEFAEKLKAAEAEVLDKLEEEAYRRAVKGVKKPVYYQGALVGYELTYSDKLLEMLLRGRAKDKYGNTSSVKVEGSIEHNVTVESVKEKLLDKVLQRGIVFDAEEAEDAEIIEDKKDFEDE